MGEAVCVRTDAVDEQQIYVYDGLVSQAESSIFLETMKVGAFTRTECPGKDKQHKHWVLELGLEQVAKLSFYNVARDLLAEKFPGKAYQLHRAHVDSVSFGDIISAHRDSAPDEGDVITAQWFICNYWDIDWGGETIFFNYAGEASVVVSPKSCRLVLFDGSILHVARVPNRNCYERCMTLTIKFVCHE